MIKTETMLIGGVLIGLYLFRDRIGASLNPTNPNNIINRTAESLYQATTGSSGTPGGDLYTVTHKNAESDSIAYLEKEFFEKLGFGLDTIAKAKNIGWTDTDIDNAFLVAYKKGSITQGLLDSRLSGVFNTDW